MSDQPPADALCPSCDAPIRPADINVEKGIARCQACGHVMEATDAIDHAEALALAGSAPPRGCWVVQADNAIVLGVTCFDLTRLFILAVVSVVWNGGVSLFVFGCIATTIQYYGGVLPAWLPTGPMKGFGNHPVWMWLFCIPFMFAGLMILTAAVTTAFGKFTVTLDRAADEGVLFRGIGTVGISRRFKPSATRAVWFTEARHEGSDRTPATIEIEADRTLKFGTMVTRDRLQWLAATLHVMLRPGRK